jgi:hypothetical protein
MVELQLSPTNPPTWWRKYDKARSLTHDDDNASIYCSAAPKIVFKSFAPISVPAAELETFQFIVETFQFIGGCPLV